jgi:hypothetical protein
LPDVALGLVARARGLAREGQAHGRGLEPRRRAHRPPEERLPPAPRPPPPPGPQLRPAMLRVRRRLQIVTEIVVRSELAMGHADCVAGRVRRK